METYLLKFSTCLAIFWLVYFLFLERQTMHRFKRFYLLGALALAIVIPTLTIIEYVEPVVRSFETSAVFVPMENSTERAIEEPSFFDLETMLLLIYALGVLLLTIRFVVNLIKMNRRISRNVNIKKRTLVMCYCIKI